MTTLHVILCVVMVMAGVRPVRSCDQWQTGVFDMYVGGDLNVCIFVSPLDEGFELTIRNDTDILRQVIHDFITTQLHCTSLS